MNDTTTETALADHTADTVPSSTTESTEPKAKKKPVKKAAKPKTKPTPKVAKKKATPKVAKPKAEPKPKKDDLRKVSGLRRFQIRTLKALNESTNQLTVAGIAKRAKISHTMVVMGLGTIDPKLLKVHDKKMGFPSLITLGHVKVVEIEGITAIQITASGKKALTSELAKVNGKLPKVKTAAA